VGVDAAGWERGAVEAHVAPAGTQAAAQSATKLKKGFLDVPASKANAGSNKGAEPMVSLKGAKKSAGMGGSNAKVIPGTPRRRSWE
jgi:hypothetical protein